MTTTPDHDETLDQVLPAFYDDLRQLAAQSLQREANGHTLQPTALAHEAYLRLSRSRGDLMRERAYFLSSAADVIRRVLIDHARARSRLKRGGGWTPVSLEGLLAPGVSSVDILTLQSALDELREMNARHARVVELRFYGGLEVSEIAGVLGISSRTVNNDWRTARAWLHGRLKSLSAHSAEPA